MAHTYIALFRGINVGKAKRISMAELRKLFEGLGHSNVRTLLNSGNVVFTSVRSVDSVRRQIEKALLDNVGIQSRTTIITAGELQDIVDNNSLKDMVDNPSRHLIAVLQNAEDRKKLLPLARQNWDNEAIAVGKRVAYLWCPNGVLESKVADTVNRLLGADVTTRNWATMQKLHKMAVSSSS